MSVIYIRDFSCCTCCAYSNQTCSCCTTLTVVLIPKWFSGIVVCDLQFATLVAAHVALTVTTHAVAAPHWRLCCFKNSFWYRCLWFTVRDFSCCTCCAYSNHTCSCCTTLTVVFFSKTVSGIDVCDLQFVTLVAVYVVLIVTTHAAAAPHWRLCCFKNSFWYYCLWFTFATLVTT